jgi:hypothetical protein
MLVPLPQIYYARLNLKNLAPPCQSSCNSTRLHPGGEAAADTEQHYFRRMVPRKGKRIGHAIFHLVNFRFSKNAKAGSAAIRPFVPAWHYFVRNYSLSLVVFPAITSTFS